MRSELQLHRIQPQPAQSAWQASVRAATLLAAAWFAACADESVVDPPTAAVASDAGLRAMAMARAGDRDILVAFYNATDGPNWVNDTNWLTDAPLGDWHGVRTDAAGRVTALNLEENGLSGSMPSDLGRLAQLVRLDLADNHLSGPIPADLGRLANLGTLWLARNELTGSIPPSLGDLANVVQMSLSANELSGTIPAELGGMVNLKYWQLQGNDLTGTIPSELGNLTEMVELSLDGNRLTGLIPESFLKLIGLTSFGFARNHGLCAPGSARFVAWLQSIRYVRGPYCNEVDAQALADLHRTAGGSNWSTSTGWLGDGPLGEWYGVETDSIGRVTSLALAANGLVGRLPASLGDLASMTRLLIGDNPALSGRLPTGLSRTPLEELRYANTGLCAPTGGSFQEWLSGLARHEGTGTQCPPLSDREILTAVYETTDGDNWEESGNWLTDAPLGTWHGVETDADGRVVSLKLVRNGLEGPIPPELGELTELGTLSLWGNELSGPIPPELGALASLKELALHRNQLSGSIPAELGGLTGAEYVALSINSLSGPIPAELGALPRLQELHLNNNQLTSVPAELGGLASLKELALEYNRLTSVPRELGRLASLEVLWILGNELMTVPGDLGELHNLQVLRLGANMLTSVPPEFGSLVNLLVLDIGSNRLSSVPRELGRLDNLEVLWLHLNDLTSIPNDLGNLRNLEWLALEHNRLSSVPPGLGGMASLELLELASNKFASFPRELAALPNLSFLDLAGNQLTDVPTGLVGAGIAQRLALSASDPPASHKTLREPRSPWEKFQGIRSVSVSTKPDELGALRARIARDGDRSSRAARSRTVSFPSLEILDLSSNEFSGSLPAGLLEFTGIASLGLAANAGLAGPLPLGLTALEHLEDLHTTGTGLCAPADPEFLDWLEGVTRQRVAHCARDGDAAAYLTQAVQSREFPVPLVAGESALLRVFVTAKQGVAAMPPVRATFYRDGAVTHVADIPGASDPIPAKIDESSLSKSANAEIPGRVIQPGLEVVIEPDPDGMLDPALGVARRIPASGRMAVDVRTMPVFEVTLVPFIWQESLDSSIIETVAAMAADPEGH